MFNSTTTINQDKYSFNSVSGTLVKSDANSKFLKFEGGSKHANTIFDVVTPYLTYPSSHKNVNVEVLQVMLCGDNTYLLEYRQIA